jgi:hypothetical protein
MHAIKPRRWGAAGSFGWWFASATNFHTCAKAARLVHNKSINFELLDNERL